MQSIFLNYYQRVLIWNMIGAHPAPGLKEASVLLRVIEKVRLSDRETIDTEFRPDGPNLSWKLPENGYGDKVIELENEEATALAGVIENTRPIRVADAGWLLKIVAQLSTSPKTVEAFAVDGVQ